MDQTNRELKSSAILLVDDNEEIHSLFEHSFKRTELVLLSARTATEALRLLQTESVQLVLLDIELPDMNGIECLRQIRKSRGIENLPVLILTGHADPAYILSALEAGANDYLLKPLGVAIMIERVRLHMKYCSALWALEQIHLRNKEILDFSPDLIFRINPEGEILDLNKSPEGMLIQIFEAVHGSHSAYLLTDEVRSAVLEFVKKQEPRGTILIKRVGDKESAFGKVAKCFELRLVSCGHQGAICFVRDITAIFKRERELLELVGSDPLTKIGNRRRFSENVKREWKRQLRDKKPLSLVLIDIDHFKQLNDNLGHLEGDKCLINIAASLESSCMRPGDLVARYGGEEFVVLLPETDEAGALCVAERLRKKVESLMIPESAEPGARMVTISLGVATVIPGFSMTTEELLRRADQALYFSKRNGRNKVTEFNQVRSLAKPIAS